MSAPEPNRFLVHDKDGKVSPWPIHEAWTPDLPIDARYFGEVMRRVDDALPSRGLTFIMTWSLDDLPERGSHVVPLLLGDEHCQIPRYVDDVRATLKEYGVRPHWPWPPLALGPLPFRDALKHTMLLRETAAAARDAPVRRLGSILTVPLGYYNQLDLPYVPLAERTIDVYFAGDLGSDGFTLSPKSYARQRLMRAVERLRAERPDLRIETASSFSTQARPLGPQEYSERMAQAKVSLCPRGSNLETWRLFESARAGCLVVHEPLPTHDFYRSLPGTLTRDWGGLTAIVDAALRDPAAAQSSSDRTLEWWRTAASEPALARAIVDHLGRTEAA